MTLIDSVSEKTLLEISQQVFQQIANIENKMSYFDLDSELNHLNQNAYHQPVPISAEMAELLAFCLRLSELTHGAFDISVTPKLIKKQLLPDHQFPVDLNANWQDILIVDNTIQFKKPLIIELGGVAKGYAVDQAVQAIADLDCQGMVNAGGDLKMTNWQQQVISVRHPQFKSGTTVQVEMQNAALATSAHYFLDGKTAITHPMNQLQADQDKSISIFADSCMVADALTKVGFLYNDSPSVLAHFGASLIELNR